MSETKYDQNCVGFVLNEQGYRNPNDLTPLTEPADSKTANMLVTFSQNREVIHAETYDPKHPKITKGLYGDELSIIFHPTPVKEETMADGSYTQF